MSPRQTGAQLRALHGPHGPCRWLLSRLLDWGGTSARFLLLLACQLGSFLTLQPALVECYSREIQMILLWGSRKGGETRGALRPRPRRCFNTA